MPQFVMGYVSNKEYVSSIILESVCTSRLQQDGGCEGHTILPSPNAQLRHSNNDLQTCNFNSKLRYP